MPAGRRALVTGGSGFVGQWLVRALLRRGYAVTATDTDGVAPISVLTEAERAAVRWQAADVRREEALHAVLQRDRPDAIFHLAGIAYVPAAQRDPVAAYDVNGLGIARVLGALRPLRTAGDYDPAVVVVGSAEQYGRHDEGTSPLDERAPLRPLTVYAASKVVQETVALQVHRADGVRVVCTRSFNHSGPGQAEHFLLPALVQRALRLRAGGDTLALGNTSPVRDYLHVSDVAEAYCLLAEHGAPGEVYNVASGEGISVRELVEAVLRRVGVSARLTTDPALVRPVDLPVLVGSAAKLHRDTGWVPRRSRDDVIDDLIRYFEQANAPTR